MKTSYNFLRSYTDIHISPSELAEKLTQQGLEVEEMVSYGEDLDSIIIAQITAKIPHSNAENLSICSVYDGSKALQIVCGAKNFKLHDKVLLAPVGTVMPNNIEIRESEIRGILSQGMLCSSKELGLFDSEGLWILPEDAPVGEKLITWLKFEKDYIYDISLTPNRGDCLGTLGIAREVAILEKKSAHCVIPKLKDLTINPKLTPPVVQIKSPDCPRYTSRIIKNVRVTESPLWLKLALKKYGLHSINNIVDASNYVMMELGQPVHIFDMELISFPITVENAKKGDSLLLLSNEEISVPEHCLLIKDNQKNLALAGVMGGLYSGVSPKTQNIVLEVAYFLPDAVRNTVKHTNIHTDASYRYTRNTDVQNIPKVMDFLTQVVLEVSSGDVSEITDYYPSPSPERKISFPLEFIHQKLGFVIAKEEVEQILSYLGFAFVKTAQEHYEITVPSYRNDCHISMDIVEEIIRVYGYDRMPISVPKINLSVENPLSKTPFVLQLKELLVSYGLQEIYTFSLTNKENNLGYSLVGEESIAIKNPLNGELSHLRASLFSTVGPYIQGILEKGTKSIHGFEIGNIFYQDLNNTFFEHTHLLLFQAGEKTPINFKKTHHLIDFYDTKAHLQALFNHLNLMSFIDFRPLESVPFLHPYKTAGIYYLDEYIGFIGEIHPKFWKNYKGKNNLVVAEINISSLQERVNMEQTQKSYFAVSKFPRIERDLAFVLDTGVLAQEIVQKIKSLSPLVLRVEAVDSYEHEKLGAHKRSLSFKIFFQSASQTLTDQDIQPIINELIEWVKQEKQGILREF